MKSKLAFPLLLSSILFLSCQKENLELKNENSQHQETGPATSKTLHFGMLKTVKYSNNTWNKFIYDENKKLGKELKFNEDSVAIDSTVFLYENDKIKSKINSYFEYYFHYDNFDNESLIKIEIHKKGEANVFAKKNLFFIDGKLDHFTFFNLTDNTSYVKFFTTEQNNYSSVHDPVDFYCRDISALIYDHKMNPLTFVPYSSIAPYGVYSNNKNNIIEGTRVDHCEADFSKQTSINKYDYVYNVDNFPVQKIRNGVLEETYTYYK